jgi:DNA repair photolyase
VDRRAGERDDAGAGGGLSAEDAVRRLLEPLLTLTSPSPTGWRLVGWDADQGVSLTLGRGESLLLVEAEARDDTRACFARTARFNVVVRPQFRGDEALTDDERRVAEQVVRILRDRERLLPVLERPAASRPNEVREVEVDRVLVPEGRGHYYVNPYVGCMIGCDFCYAAHRSDLSRALGGLSEMPWGRYVDVKINAAEVLRREVKEHPPGIVRLSPIVTDPYQPLERRFRITRQCLEVLLEAGFTPLVLTRAARVLDDVDLLARFPRAAVGLSVPTDDDAMRRIFEPGGDPIDERLDALARCHAAGIRTFGVVQPMLPMTPGRLVEKMAPHVSVVRIDRMHELSRSRALYEAAGRVDASEDAFFDETAAALRAGFGAAGVAVDDLDDVGDALGLV